MKVRSLHVAFFTLFLAILLPQQTTNALNDASATCQTEFGAVDLCFVDNDCETKCAGIAVVTVGGINCSQTNTLVCNTFSCCSVCFPPLELYYECIFAIGGVSCDLDCSNITAPPTLPPTLPPTAPPTLPSTLPPTLPPALPPTLPPTSPQTLPSTFLPTAPPTSPPTSGHSVGMKYATILLAMVAVGVLVLY